MNIKYTAWDRKSGEYVDSITLNTNDKENMVYFFEDFGYVCKITEEVQ